MREKLARRAPQPVAEVARVGIRVARRVGYSRARWARPLGTRPPVGLAVCAIFRDEAPYLAEWLTFHRLHGVERFYLYDNRSTDDWRDEVAPEPASGVVHVTPWPEEPGQFSAYNACLRRRRTEARWIAFIDVDEFLFSPTGRSLPDVLRTFDTSPGVVANWRVYGPGGHERRPEGLVTENYVRRARDGHHYSHLVKSIVYPRKTHSLSTTPHAFRHYGRAVGEDKRPRRSDTFYRDSASADLLRINHYYSKSLEELDRKLARGRSDVPSRRSDEEAYGFVRDSSETRDEILLQFVPALKHALASRDNDRRGRRIISTPA
jgi:hypothetical protein